MDDWNTTRLTDSELKAFFNRLFPDGFAGSDVLAEIAPEGWEQSPLLACFHPSPEQVFTERLRMHRNLEDLFRAWRNREPTNPRLTPQPEPTLDQVRADWTDQPVSVPEEVTELIGLCLWDVFSDNHEVIAPDGRIADIGSFRGSSAFLDECVSGESDAWNLEASMRFYMGTIWTSGRADLTPVYRMIFRRLKAEGADWEFHFPELGVVDFARLREQQEHLEDYSPSEAFAREQEAAEREAEVERFRADLVAGNAQARREAMDRPPPVTVRAYQQVFRRDPKGWPPEED